MENESKLIPITDAMGREIFWEDLGRKNDWRSYKFRRQLTHG